MLRDALCLYDVLIGNGSWTGQTRRATIEGQQALLDSLQTSGDQEAIAQAEQKLEAVKVARKRQGDGDESTCMYSISHSIVALV
jgi:hypothetical protein